MTTEYPRGSEWRRWDLHVHTASSYDYKYNNTDSDEKLVDALNREQIKAVAITDHFCIDKDRISNLRKLAPEIVFFPGVELRTDKGSTNIHVILIFSDQIDLNILVEDFNVFKRSAKNAEDNEKIYWDYNQIVNFAKDHDAIISVHAGSKSSGVDDKISNVLPVSQAVKTEYSETVAIFEMGKLKDLEDYKLYVFPSIGIKPMIICSDNHDPRNYFPKNKLWIKADPTFNGLKQILYEPEERIRISETQPEIKEDYYVIDRVEFDNKDFQTDPIYFNDKLTCIIGGKSTGKSILLQNMANRIDPLEAQKNIKKSETKTLEITSLRVFWRDGEEKDRKIIYIPQTYLNKLSDSKQEKTEIDQWIQEVLFRREEIKKAYEIYSLAIRDLSIDVNTNIINFISKNEECIENIKAQRDIGDKQGIMTTIQKLELERTAISKDLKISEDDIKTYNNALGNVQKANDNIIKLEQDKTIILSMDSLVQNKNLNPSISELSKDNILKIQENIVNTANQKWQDAKSSIIKDIEDKITQENINLADNTKLFNEKKPLVDSSRAILEITKRIQEEERKQKLLEEKEKVLKSLVEEKNKFLKYLCLVPEKYKKINNEYQNIINAAKIEDKDISFFADVVFRSEALTEKLSTLFDIRNKNYKEIVKDSLSETDYIKKLKEIIEKTINEELPTKSGFSKEDVLREILISWYNTTYKVKMEEDTLDVMSPGKKALVLLKVLIGLAENKCPILIDQPEDDLDNRSIYSDLVNYIKEKKKERQIIIVTHNANIVIGSDAEEVIVANQKGKNSPNRKFRFEYKSGAIENNTATDKSKKIEALGILNSQGIQQHICDILEGGEKAFELRKNKYHI